MYTYILPTGELFPLEAGNRRFILSEEGLGMADTNDITQQGPFQDGETLLDSFLKPRVIQFIVRANTRCYEQYYKERALYLDALRPNRGQGVLRALLPGNIRRDIKVKVQQGPDFEKAANRGWDEWSFSTMVRFIAYDPTFYDPQQKSLLIDAFGGFVFPITFPLTIVDYVNNVLLAYPGTFKTSPVFTFTGPMITCVITNETTGDVLQIIYPMDVGEVVQLDLAYGNISIVNNYGVDLMQYLTLASNITTFHLTPGVNELRFEATGTGATSRINMAWYDRYIGLGGEL
jgi:hypothetical protein